MFNTALLANVSIVERHQHSQRVTYVPLGRDADIMWGSQDFRWKNNTVKPIKIKMSVKDGTISQPRLDESVLRVLQLKERYGLI